MAVSNKFCLVTGASSGIGKYIAYEMVHRGWKVIAIARRKNKLEKLAKYLGEDKLIPKVCDVSKFDQVRCGVDNSPSSIECIKCGFPLSEEKSIEMLRRREKAESLWDIASRYPQLLQILEDVLRKESLGKTK